MRASLARSALADSAVGVKYLVDGFQASGGLVVRSKLEFVRGRVGRESAGSRMCECAATPPSGVGRQRRRRAFRRGAWLLRERSLIAGCFNGLRLGVWTTHGSRLTPLRPRWRRSGLTDGSRVASRLGKRPAESSNSTWRSRCAATPRHSRCTPSGIAKRVDAGSRAPTLEVEPLAH